MAPFKEKKEISLKPQCVQYAVEDRFEGLGWIHESPMRDFYSNSSILSRFLSGNKVRFDRKPGEDKGAQKAWSGEVKSLESLRKFVIIICDRLVGVPARR